jgi:hypothetical protein
MQGINADGMMDQTDPDGPLTPEQVRMLATPDDELRKTAAVMSFDTDKLARRITEDAGQSIIQAHLYFDHIVTLCIAGNVPNPDALHLDRIGFSQKLDLLHALGIEHPKLSAFLRKLNSLRNKLSHDLDFEIGEDEISTLRSALGRSLSKFIENDPLKTKGWRLDKCLVLTIIMLELHRQALNANALVGKKVSAELRWVAEEIRSGRKFSYVKAT